MELLVLVTRTFFLDMGLLSLVPKFNQIIELAEAGTGPGSQEPNSKCNVITSTNTICTIARHKATWNGQERYQTNNILVQVIVD